MNIRTLLRRCGRVSGRKQFLSETLESRLLLAAVVAPSSVGVSVASGYVPGEVLVQWKPDIPSQNLGLQTLSIPGEVLETIETPVMLSLGAGRVERVRLTGGISVEEAVATLQADPRVSVAEPNWIYESTAVSNDPQYLNGGLWGMYSSDSPVSVGPAATTNIWGSQAEQVWNNGVTGSSGVIIGVIDQGIQTTHPDLVNNIWVNPFETPGDGIDNDGNGYIDDINGWDFVNNDNTVYDGTGDSHGTHVAGTIGATGGNGLGVTGVNWNVSMISLKFMGSTGGTTANAIRAIDYLTNLKIRHGLNIVASNNSWGGGAYSRLLHEAIIRGANQDILFVAAAGNATANNDAVASYPANYNTTARTPAMAAASYDAVISVAAITQTGTLASYSNYGATSVDIAAPGDSILSTVPGGYGTRNGTSMAAPHVTGAIALFASTMPGLVPAAVIRSALLSGAAATPSVAGKTVTGGRLNVLETLRRAAGIELDRDVYGPSQSMNITVTSVGGNADSQLRDTLIIRVQSTTETTHLDVTLTETGHSTGIFQGTVQLAAGPATADHLLQVSHGDQVTASLPQLALTDVATIDALPPAISGISFTTTGSTAAVSWNTSEPASATIRFGRSADSLNRSMTIPNLASAQNTILHALDAAAGYFCRIEATDANGNTETSDIRTFTTLSPAPILFVDDDEGAAFETHFRTALNANALSFDEWNVFAGSRLPAAANLSSYSLVIWNTGAEIDAPQSGLSEEEQNAIAAYLNAGGRIFLSGQDILFNGVSPEFLQNYLKIASYVDDAIAGAHTESGVPGSQITHGMTLPIAIPDGYPVLLADAVEPVPGANGLLLHHQPAITPAWSGVSYHGNYSAGGFGMVFSSLPFESISSSDPQPNNQTEFLRRIVQFLNADITPGVQIIPPAVPVTTEAGDASSFAIVLTSQPSHPVTIPLASSDSSEGSLSVGSVSFTSDNWNIPQTIVVTGIDDPVNDGDVSYSVIIAPTVSADPLYHGIDPEDFTLINLDNDSTPHAKFYTVDDGDVDSAFTYDADGTPLEHHSVNTENTAPRGIAMTTAGDRFWVVDESRTVFVYETSGTLLGSWTANFVYSISDVQGIATDGSDIWIVERLSDRVYYFPNAASRLSGAQTASSSWFLNFRNAEATDMVFGSQNGRRYLWIVNDSTVDRVYRYTLNASGGMSGVVSWPLHQSNASPTGIALDPGNGSMDIWVADAGTSRVYRYKNARTASAPVLASSFALAPANTNVQGIADPPPPTAETRLGGYESAPGDEYTTVGQSATHSFTRRPAVRIIEPPEIAVTALETADRKVLNLKLSPNRSPALALQYSPGNSFDVVRSTAPPQNSALDLFADQTELDLLFDTL